MKATARKTRQTALSPPAAPPFAKPFIKWVGGKSRLLNQFEPFFPPRDGVRQYFEPFLGSGAVFFHLRPARATLSDVNLDLITLYKVIRDDPHGLMKALDRHEVGKNDPIYFYRVRDELDPDELLPVERAARLVFLNKTCYNGLYRVNRAGRFNTPFGRYENPTLYDKENILAASRLLEGKTILHGDYREACAPAGKGDFVYFDPPYFPLSRTSNFTGYSGQGFDYDQQVQLFQTAVDLHERGAKVMLSNSAAPEMIKLFSSHPAFTVHTVRARRAINSVATKRGEIDEILVTND